MNVRESLLYYIQFGCGLQFCCPNLICLTCTVRTELLVTHRVCRGGLPIGTSYYYNSDRTNLYKQPYLKGCKCNNYRG